MATTIPTAAAQVGEGRTPHKVRIDGFHANALCGRRVSRQYDEREAAKVTSFCKGCEKAEAVLLAETAVEEAPAVEVVEATATPAPVVDEETPARTPAVHRFETSSDAYDATQALDGISDGDVIVVESEKVVGFLVRAWPAAITVARGSLHMVSAPDREHEDGAYAASVDLAEQLANELGFDVDPLHATPAPVAEQEAPAQDEHAEDLPAGAECVHGNTERPGDPTRPAATCAAKGSAASVGIFGDEGCVDRSDCAVQASETVHRLNAEHDAECWWAVTCPAHEEEPATCCEECATDEDDEPGDDVQDDVYGDEPDDADQGEQAPADAAPEQPAQEAERFYAEVSRVLAYPGHYEDRIRISEARTAETVERVALPAVATRSARSVLAALGWELVEDLEYIAASNLESGLVRRVEPAQTPEAVELRAAILRETTARTVALADNARGAHFRAVMPADGGLYPIGWTYRNTGFGENSQYAWVTAQGRGTDRVGVPTREAAEEIVRDWHATGKDAPTDTALVDVIADLPADELAKAGAFLHQHTEDMPATFAEGDRVLCVDGLVRTARYTETKDGKVWIVMKDRSAWPVKSSELIDTSRVETATADALRAAETLRATAAAPDPAALAELGDALRYLRHADPAAHAALIEGADRIAVRIPRADLAPGDVLHDQGPHDVLDVCTVAPEADAPGWWAQILGHTKEVRAYTGRKPWSTALRLDLARTDEVSVDRPLPGISPMPAPFAEGDRIVCADGTAHTVRAMSPIVRDEPARVVVEDGTEWIAENCRRANSDDVDAARAASARAAVRVRTNPNPADPEWEAALDELATALDFLKIVDPVTRAALIKDEAVAAVHAIHAEAHDFQPFARPGHPATVGWSFRTGHGVSARYGIVTTDVKVSPVGLYEYRTTAERAYLYADRRFTAAPVTG
ncbi:hypothetical protein [[Kitasatospora] papulosa]|uniref:hypothetical protein n=1 Tax=[Kitasatospora] papulosa TaxID=1464011 RepID=UPI0036A3F8F1